MNKELIEQFLEEQIQNYPICEYAFGNIEQIPFTEKIFTICETDCKRYGHSWACPPYAGTVEDNIRRVKNYSRFFIFSTVWEVTDAFNQEACLAVRPQHEEIARELRELVLNRFELPKTSPEELPVPKIRFLSSGCCSCEICACPEEPCRHPEDRLMSMESHGILILKLAEDCGMTYSFDSGSVVYFSMVLF